MDPSSSAGDNSGKSEDSVCDEMQTNGDLVPSGEVEKWHGGSSDVQMSRTEDSSSSQEDTKDSISSAGDLDEQNIKSPVSGGAGKTEQDDKTVSGSSLNKPPSKPTTDDDDDDDDDDDMDEESQESRNMSLKRKREAGSNEDLDDSTSTENSLDSSEKHHAGSSCKRQCLSDTEKMKDETVELLTDATKPSASDSVLSKESVSADSVTNLKDDSDSRENDKNGEEKDTCDTKCASADGSGKNDSVHDDSSSVESSSDKCSESVVGGSEVDKSKQNTVKGKTLETPKGDTNVPSDLKKPGSLITSERRQLSNAKSLLPFQVDKHSGTSTVIGSKKPITNFDPFIREMTEEEKAILEQEAGFPDFLKDIVKLGKYIPVKRQQNVDVTLRTGESLIECPSQVSPLLVKKPNTVLSQPTQPTPKSDKPPSKAWGNEYFNTSAARLLMTVGFSRALEWYEKDMVKVKEKQLKRNKESKGAEEDLQMHRTAYFQAKRANEPFNTPLKKCQDCDFRTESDVVLEGHRLTPHVTSRREFKCSFCSFLTRDTKAIVFHMEALHGKKGSVEPPRLFYECPFCPFETNLKTKATSHINKCQKYFFPGNNQAPTDIDYPGVTAKPVTLEDIRMYEINFTAIANASQVDNNQLTIDHHRLPSGITLTRVPSTQNESHRFSSSLHGPRMTAPTILPLTNSGVRQKALPFVRTVRPAAGSSFLQVVSSSGQVLPMLNSSALSQVAMLPPGTTVHAVSKTPQPVALFPNVATADSSRASQVPPRPSVPSAAFASRHGPHTGQNSFVICEICDGYIKDLEQLRTHMQWIHKVKIHPKMLASRPPLNCQKCQWRFFTDQGLERHLLGAHGLVTSNMQDMVNSNQDGGRCTICGKVFACKLVAHMSQIHKITLKPAHLSYKCTVCSATFNLYRLFENHVYMVHSGAMKRPSDDSKKKGLSSTTSTPQTASSSASSSTASSMSKPAPASKTLQSAPALTIKPTTVSEAKEQPKVVQEETNNESKSDSKNEQNSLPETASKNGERPKDAEPPDKGEEKDLTGESDASSEESDNCDDGTNCKTNCHAKKKSIRPCGVKLCRIEQCEKCLFSFDGLVVLHTSDFGADEDDDDEDDDDIVCEDDDEIECLPNNSIKVNSSHIAKPSPEEIKENDKENDVIELEIIEVNKKNDFIKTKNDKQLVELNNIREINNKSDKLASCEFRKSNACNAEHINKALEDGEKDIEVMEEICTIAEKENEPVAKNAEIVKEKLEKKGEDILSEMKVIDISHLDEGIEEVA